MSERIVFGNTFDGMRHALLAHGVQQVEIERRFRSIGVELTKKLNPAYSGDTFVAALKLSAELAFPGRPSDEAFRGVGRFVIEGFSQTLVGRAAHALARIIGPRRLIKQMTKNFRHSDNFLEARITEVSENTLDVWVNEDFGCGGYHEGVLETAAALSGAKDVRAVRVGGQSPEVIVRLTWSL